MKLAYLTAGISLLDFSRFLCHFVNAMDIACFPAPVLDLCRCLLDLGLGRLLGSFRWLLHRFLGSKANTELLWCFLRTGSTWGCLRDTRGIRWRSKCVEGATCSWTKMLWWLSPSLTVADSHECLDDGAEVIELQVRAMCPTSQLLPELCSPRLLATVNCVHMYTLETKSKSFY